MSPLRLLIVDDEPLARLRLRGLVEAVAEPRCTIVGEAATGGQAKDALEAQNGQGCDVVLLDIEMPGIGGLQLADELRRRTPTPLVIFVTAHAPHALRAFELEALDYLTKPVRRERLQAALARAAQRLIERTAAQASPAAPEEAGEFLTLTDRGRLRRIPLSEVLYIKAELKYLTLRTATGTHLMDGALSELAQRLGDRFLRIHRNALVARWAVRELERHAPTDLGEPEAQGGEAGDSWAVRVAGVDEWLAVSRRQVVAVREALAGQGR